MIVPPLANSTADVPMAGVSGAEPTAPAGANPLTAPLRAALAVKKKNADDLPLPGSGAAAASAPAAAAPAPIPLPQ